MAIMRREIAKAEGLIHLMQYTQDATPVGQLAEEFTLLIGEAAGEQLLEFSRCIKKCQGTVSRAREFAGGIDDLLKHELKIQARCHPVCQLAKKRQLALETKILLLERVDRDVLALSGL
jgi:hypothetical protein